MEQISLLGWVCIATIILVAAVINVIMIGMLRNFDPRTLNRNIRMPKHVGRAQNMHNIVEVLRDPFADERKSLQELSNSVEKFKTPPSQSLDSSNPQERKDP